MSRRILQFGRRVFLFYALAGPCTKVFPQHFHLQKYTVNDGLADSYILSINQDSQGFLWVGTVSGLSRFDGKDFLNYGHGEGLPDLVVDVVYEDHAKRIWAGTRKGIVEIKGRKCRSYPMDDRQTPSFVFGIRESKKYGLLALTDLGIYRFDSCQWKKQVFYPGFDNHLCRNMVEAPEGLFLNYGDRMVFRDHAGRYSIVGKPQADRQYYKGLFICSGGRYLILQDRLLWIRGGDTVALFEKALRHKNPGGFICDSRGRFWLTTAEEGLLVSRKGSMQVISDTIPVTFNMVSRLFEDREGNVWAACFDGLLKIREVDYKEWDQRQYPLLTDTRHLVASPDNTVMACARSGLLVCRKEGPAPFSFAGKFPMVNQGGQDIVDFSCRDAEGNPWLVTRRRKLYHFERNGLQDLSGLAHCEDDHYRGTTWHRRDHALYLCSDTLLCGNRWGMQPFRDAISGKKIVAPRSACYFDNGSLLVSTANEFLEIDSGKRILNITQRIGITGSRPGICYYAEPSGKFWIGYDGGLARFHWDSMQLPVRELAISTREGLPNNSIHALTMDRQHRLWAITSSGLIVVETDGPFSGQPIIHRLSEEMGISYDQWIQARLLADTAGNIWMSFLNRIFCFTPAALRFREEPPSVAIEDIQLNPQPAGWRGLTDSLYGYRQLPGQASLPYHLNNLCISFKAPCFTGISGIEYSYQLEGSDSGWSRPSRSPSVNFVKISPGVYHFKVRARKSDTDWGPPAAFDFRIGKPWWEQAWLRLLAVGAFLALTVYIFRLRIRQVRRKDLIRDQLQELELKALRSQMNPHFIYNALNSIQALVVDRKPQEASLYIGKFGRLMRQVLDHSERHVVSLREELETLQLYIDLERLRLNVNFQYRVIPDPAIIPGKETLPSLILQPFVENALWHGLSRKPGEKTLDILVGLRDEWLEIRIIDNGIGREQAAAGRSPANAKKTSKGIDITGRRLKEYNRSPGPVLIAIKDLYDADRRPAGTEVTLRIMRKRVLFTNQT